MLRLCLDLRSNKIKEKKKKFQKFQIHYLILQSNANNLKGSVSKCINVLLVSIVLSLGKKMEKKLLTPELELFFPPTVFENQTEPKMPINIQTENFKFHLNSKRKIKQHSYYLIEINILIIFKHIID